MTMGVVEWAENVVCSGPRDVIAVTGADAERYLQSQFAQDLTGMTPGVSRWSLLLEPDGKVVALCRVVRSDEGFNIDSDPGSGDVVHARLRRFLLRVDVSMVLTSATSSVADDAEAQRVARGWPRHGAEIIPSETLPAELGVIPFAVSFTKGCYPGQELVERMDARGASAPFHLVVIDESMPVGSNIVVDGASVGTVTSAAGGYSIARVRRAATVGTAAPIN